MQYFPSLCSLCNVQYLEAWDELQWNGRRVQYLAKSVSLASLSEITKCMTDIGSFLALLFYCETALVAMAYFSTVVVVAGFGSREKSRLWKENSLLQIAKLKGLGTPLVSVAGWCVSSSGTQTDSDGGVVTLVTARVTARPALVSCARCGRRGGAGPSLYTNIGHLLCLTSIY